MAQSCWGLLAASTTITRPWLFSFQTEALDHSISAYKPSGTTTINQNIVHYQTMLLAKSVLDLSTESITFNMISLGDKAEKSGYFPVNNGNRTRKIEAKQQ